MDFGEDNKITLTKRELKEDLFDFVDDVEFYEHVVTNKFERVYTFSLLFNHNMGDMRTPFCPKKCIQGLADKVKNSQIVKDLTYEYAQLCMDLQSEVHDLKEQLEEANKYKTYFELEKELRQNK